MIKMETSPTLFTKVDSPPIIVDGPESPQSCSVNSPSSSPSLPPSPPSSCGSQSPPSTPNAQETQQKPHQPIPSSPSSATPKEPPKNLPFSIENILRPEFGPHKTQQSPPISPDVLRTPPKTPELGRSNDFPVDLSRKPNNSQNQSQSTSLPVPPLKQITDDTSTDSDTNTISSNCSATKTAALSSNPRVRHPDNPEELANPSVPDDNMVWPAWVYCTRYSDRPSSGPRSRRMKRRDRNPEEKRPRTAFTSEQLSRLKHEFEENKYLSEKRRQELARELGLNESQIKIWFQNKRAKIKKTTIGQRNGLAQHLMAQGLYNHSTVPLDEDDPFLN